MRLLTPSEKLFILENKALPKKEVERIAELLRAKFRFSPGRPNGNLIPTYLEKVEIGKDGKVDRNQEYIRRIAKVLDNANTELVAAAIEHALANKGVYEFKIPSGLMDKAKELAAQIVDNGFSYKEFIEWLNGAKAYKNDAEEIMKDGNIKSLNALYTQLLGTTNEASAVEDMIAVAKPEEIEAYREFAKLVAYLEQKYKAGTDYHIMADSSLTIDPEILAVDTKISDMLNKLGDYGDKIGTNEAANEHGEFDDKAEFEQHIKDNFGEFTVKGGPNYDIYLVDGKDVGHWNIGSDGNEDFGTINEGRMQIKRAYKRNGVELKPAITVAEEAVMRNKIVKHLGSQPLCRASKKSILEFFNALNEDAEVGRVPSAGWLYRNQHLVKKIKVGKDAFYKLTRAGLNLFNKLNKTVNEEVEEETAIDEAESFSIFDILDMEGSKKVIEECPEGETVILIPHYSINVQSKYEDGEELQDDLDAVEAQLGTSVMVNDYDDLIADPHGVLSDGHIDERRGGAHEDEVVDALVPYYALVRDDDGFTNLQIGRGGKSFTFETAKEVPHHYEDGKTEIQKFEVGVDGDDIYCLFDNNGDEQSLKSPEDLKEYTGAGSANEAMTEAEMEATKDWFSTLGEIARDGFMDRFQDETGTKIDDATELKDLKAFWRWLAGEQQVAMQEAAEDSGSYEIMVMGDDQDIKMALKDAIEMKIPDNITIAGNDFGVIINDDIDRLIFDREFARLDDSSGLTIQAFKNDAPVELKPHAEMIRESVDPSEYFTVQQPTREQMVTYRALQMYLKRHYTDKDYNTTSSGTLRIKKAIQEKLTPYLKSLDVIQPGAAK